MQRKCLITLAAAGTALAVSGALTSNYAALAAESITAYQIVIGNDGKQYYVNRHQRAVRLPGSGVDGGIVRILQNSRGQRWYVASDGTQVDVPWVLPSYPVKKVVDLFVPLVDSPVPLGRALHWGPVGPFFWAPGHRMHPIDNESPYFKELDDWHRRGYWEYDRVANTTSSENESTQGGKQQRRDHDPPGKRAWERPRR